MNIYIYGNSKFNKEIHELLEHANTKFRLGDSGSIIELKTLPALKNAIEKNPEDMYLIDDSKIIKKNSLNSKFKFLTPKNGIEQEYLLDHGIGDMSVDSLEELAKHIILKLDALSDEEDIADSIRDIVDEAYDENKENDFEDLDPEFTSLLVHEDINNKIEIDNKEDEVKEESNFDDDDMDDFFTQMPKMEDDILATSSKDYFDEHINEKNPLPIFDEKIEHLDDLPNLANSTYETINKKLINELTREGVKEEDFNDLDFLISSKLSSDSQKKKEKLPVINQVEKKDNSVNIQKSDIINKPKEGEKMSDNFMELDSLNESDILSALEGLNEEVNTPSTLQKKTIIKESKTPTESITVEANNLDDISQLIKQLLNNKTLEISIRIKD